MSQLLTEDELKHYYAWKMIFELTAKNRKREYPAFHIDRIARSIKLVENYVGNVDQLKTLTQQSYNVLKQWAFGQGYIQ